MPTLTIFANFYIDSDERYLRMMDSFNSFKDISAEKWVVNARGVHAEKTITFLREHLGDKLISFSLENKRGWFHDTKQMLSSINSDFVFFWLEDHINLVDTKTLDKIIIEMHTSQSEYLEYSWWNFGEPLMTYADVIEKEFDEIYTFALTKQKFRDIKRQPQPYIISMVGVFSNNLFKKIINKTPMFLRQYPKLTPFNFEKGGAETQWLSIKMAVPKREMFAST